MQEGRDMMFGSMVVVFDYDRWVKQGRKTIVTRLEWKDEKDPVD